MVHHELASMMEPQLAVVVHLEPAAVVEQCVVWYSKKEKEVVKTEFQGSYHVYVHFLMALGAVLATFVPILPNLIRCCFE